MKTVGEMLRSARIERGWTIEELEKRTKIQERFLTALEESRLQDLPAAPFVKGYIRTVAEELGLPPDTMVAVFRRDFNEDREGHIMSRAVSDTASSWRWTPTMTIAFGIAVVVVSFLGYLGVQITSFIKPPVLTLTTPKEHEVVFQSILIEGKTDPQASLSINGQDIKVRKDGVFNQDLRLDEGTQTIEVVATGQNQKTTTVERTVTVKKDETIN